MMTAIQHGFYFFFCFIIDRFHDSLHGLPLMNDLA